MLRRFDRTSAEGKCKAGNGNAVSLMLANTAMTDTNPDSVLASYRASIDNIDAALIHMLAERFRITKAVGAHKAQHTLPASDPAREERQIERLRKLAIEAQLDPDFGEKFLRFIIDEVIRHHQQAKSGDS
jgi:chorismate mutase